MLFDLLGEHGSVLHGMPHQEGPSKQVLNRIRLYDFHLSFSHIHERHHLKSTVNSLSTCKETGETTTISADAGSF